MFLCVRSLGSFLEFVVFPSVFEVKSLIDCLGTCLELALTSLCQLKLRVQHFQSAIYMIIHRNSQNKLNAWILKL